MKRVRKSVAVLPNVWEEIERKAKADSRSTSRVVELALREHLERSDGDPPDPRATDRPPVTSAT